MPNKSKGTKDLSDDVEKRDDDKNSCAQNEARNKTHFGIPGWGTRLCNLAVAPLATTLLWKVTYL